MIYGIKFKYFNSFDGEKRKVLYFDDNSIIGGRIREDFYKTFQKYTEGTVDESLLIRMISTIYFLKMRKKSPNLLR